MKDPWDTEVLSKIYQHHRKTKGDYIGGSGGKTSQCVVIFDIYWRKMSDCCFMVHHERARNEGRSKRPREQNVADGMEVENHSGTVSTSYATSNGVGSEDKMEVDPYLNQASHGDQLSGQNQKRNQKRNSSPKQVTDDSCESEDTEKGKPSNGSSSSQKHANIRQPQHQQESHRVQGDGNKSEVDGAGNPMNGSQKEGSSLTRAGPRIDDDQQSSASAVMKLSLPQHERIQHVEALDINYRSTPACLRLRESLLSRLQLVAPTGQIQVVSGLDVIISCFCLQDDIEGNVLSATHIVCVRTLFDTNPRTPTSLTIFCLLRLIFREGGSKKKMRN